MVSERKKERAAIVIERLKKEYPGADCTLDYNEAWKLLVSVRLAAQCTDERVNIIVKDLFAKYPGVNELAEAEPEDIEAIVRPCGLGKSKARPLQAAVWKSHHHGGCRCGRFSYPNPAPDVLLPPDARAD